MGLVPGLTSIHLCLFRRSVAAKESIPGVEPLELHPPSSGKKRGVYP